MMARLHIISARKTALAQKHSGDQNTHQSIERNLEDTITSKIGALKLGKILTL